MSALTEQVGQTAGGAIALENEHAAHNYHPLPVVVASGDGAWVTDINGKRYLDCLAAYSAVNFGHSNPVLLDAARAHHPDQPSVPQRPARPVRDGAGQVERQRHGAADEHRRRGR
jgi:acetylornithine/succinyldiaminopimelate/putrescine aminotransferase